MQQWEYSELQIPMHERVGALMEAGDDGWELVAAIPNMVASAVVNAQGQAQAQPGFLLIFKRPKTEAVHDNGKNGCVKHDQLLVGR